MAFWYCWRLPLVGARLSSQKLERTTVPTAVPSFPFPSKYQSSAQKSVCMLHCEQTNAGCQVSVCRLEGASAFPLPRPAGNPRPTLCLLEKKGNESCPDANIRSWSPTGFVAWDRRGVQPVASAKVSLPAPRGGSPSAQPDLLGQLLTLSEPPSPSTKARIPAVRASLQRLACAHVLQSWGLACTHQPPLCLRPAGAGEYSHSSRCTVGCSRGSAGVACRWLAHLSGATAAQALARGGWRGTVAGLTPRSMQVSSPTAVPMTALGRLCCVWLTP